MKTYFIPPSPAAVTAAVVRIRWAGEGSRRGRRTDPTMDCFRAVIIDGDDYVEQLAPNCLPHLSLSLFLAPSKEMSLIQRWMDRLLAT